MRYRSTILALTAFMLAATATMAPAQDPAAPPPAGEPAATVSDAGSDKPADAPKEKKNTVKVAFVNTPIERVLGSVAQQTGRNITARGKAVGQPISIILREVPLDQALNQIAAQRPGLIVYKPDDQPDTFEIWDQESYKAEVLPKMVRQKIFLPREITAEEAAKAVQGVLTQNIGSVAFDPKSNKVIVTDLPYVLELCQRLIEQIDVKFITRVFYISHADVTAVADKLRNMKSSAAPDPDVDERTHQIIVRDRLEVIRQMELLVETLDIGPDIRVYDLNNIGFEGADVEDLRTALDRVITKDAFYQINPRSGKLLLEDVPEVHEKVEKILLSLDEPAKQVLLQAEIIETQFNDSFNYAIDYTLSDDLFSSVIDGLTGRTAGTDSTAGNSGNVPVGSGTLDNQTLGFLNYKKEFPIMRVSGEGVSTQFLTKSAFVSLKAAMKDSRSRILQQPRVIVENQKETMLKIGQDIPYFTGGSVVNNNNGNNNFTNTPQQGNLEVGLTLTIRPTIMNSGMVQLEVELENSTPIFQQQTFAGQDFTGVGKNTQKLQSTLRIPSSETRVIGGLISDSRKDTRGGVPGLVKIPVVGPALFGSIDRPFDDNGRKNLLIFLTPSVVEDKPGRLLRYKGKLVVDPEKAVDEFLGDKGKQDGMKPLDNPLPVQEPNGQQRRRPGVKEVLQSLPPSERPAESESAAAGSDSNMITLRREAISMPAASAQEISRIPAPSGSLSIQANGSAGASAPGMINATSAQPSSAPTAPVTPPQPGSFTPPGAAAPANPFAQAAAANASGQVNTGRQVSTETRY